MNIEYLSPSRQQKENMLRQRSCVIWFTGLSGAGKTTLGERLSVELLKLGYLVQLLDGDVIRSGINNNLGFSVDDRKENIRRIAEVSKLFTSCGIIAINCFISPTIEIRQMAREIIGEADFIEVYLDASLKVCEERDVKGLYQKARQGLIPDFTGISSPYEPPEDPSLVIRTSEENVENSVQRLLQFILPRIKYHPQNEKS